MTLLGAGKLHRVGEQCVEHWLQLRRRGRNDPQNFARGRLLL